MPDMLDIKTARVFMNFMLEFNALIRRHIVESNQFRIQSHGFSMLYTLRHHKGEPLTMTEFAKELGITKQQLTKLVNDLEDQNYVHRAHNTENRRQVYIEITDEGVIRLEQMVGEILHEITKTLEDFSNDEKVKIQEYVSALSEMLQRDAVNCQKKQEELK